MWYLLHFCCTLVTLVNPFFRPVTEDGDEDEDEVCIWIHRRKFQDGRARIKYFAIGNKIYDMKTTLILNHEHKKLLSAKNILGDFSCFVVIVLLAAPSKSHIEFSGRSDQVTAACLLAKQ